MSSLDGTARLMSPADAFETAVALQRDGKIEAAEQLYLALLEIDPRHVGALHNVALIRMAQSRLGEAASLLRRAIAQSPDDAVLLLSFGSVLEAMGRQDQAVEPFERAVALAPDLALAQCRLGGAFLALARAADALRCFDRALALDGSAAAALDGKGSALQALGRAEEAIPWHKRALALAPDNASLHNNLGTALQAIGRTEEASECYARALALDGGNADHHVNRGKALHRVGRDEEAVGHYRQALAQRPQDAETLNDLGNALQSLERHGEAVDCYERALALKPGFAAAHNNLGNSLHALDRHAEAIAQYEAALRARPDNAGAASNLGTALRELGRLDAARQAFARAVALAPEQASFHLNLAEVKRFTAADAQLAQMERLARGAGALPRQEQIELHFALAKARADLGEHRVAFEHLRHGNALRRGEIAYDEGATLSVIARIAAIFTPELMRSRGGSGNPSDLPVFIIGMPRSGTSLIEQILASHPAVFGAGELTDLTALAQGYPEAVATMTADELQSLGGRYLAGLAARAPGALRITDKLPANFLLAGLIHLALPRARIIHVRRDPLDTCVSCFATLFTAGQPFAYNLGELGRYYRAYAALMAHWRAIIPEGTMLDIRYEDVVADLAGEARRIVGFCGLDWDEACLSFPLTARPVRTASAAQVRQPIYRSSIGRWRDYAAELGPLLEALAG